MLQAFRATTPGTGGNLARQTVQLYAIRHAQPDVPAGLVYGLDVPIVPPSVTDAATIARTLPDDAVWVTSLARRAIDTAFVLRGAKGQTMREAPLDMRAGFVEQHFGDWTDKMRDQLINDPTAGFHAYLADLDNAAPPNGESLAMMSARVLQARDKLVSDVTQAHPQKPVIPVVLVCHGGPIRALWAEASGRSTGDVVRNADRTFTCGYLSVARIDIRVDGGAIAAITPVGMTQLPSSRAANAHVHLT